MSFSIARVGRDDLDDLLPLMRAYCDFYEVAPRDDRLQWLARTLTEDNERRGVQLLARADDDRRALGFATIYWTYQTLSASKAAVMNDLFVTPDARGTGVAEALIKACAVEARTYGSPDLTWQTALDNERAQALYDRIGAERSQWLDYSLKV